MFLSIAAFVVLAFPIFIGVALYYDTGLKRVYYKISLFNVLKIKGYVRLGEGSVYIHLSDKTAFAIKTDKTKKILKGNSNVFKSIEILNFSADIFIDENRFLPVAAIVSTALEVSALPIIKTYKPFLRAGIDFAESKNGLSGAYIKSTLFFNLISVISIFFRKIRNSL